MTDQGKDADLPPGEPSPGTVRTSGSHPRAGGPSDAGGAHRVEGAVSVRGNLSVQSRDRIAAQLRAMYDTVVQQPVPDRFADLIARLDASDAAKS